jgi:hypothetical protein
MKLFVVVKDPTKGWEIKGVFSSEEKAIAACTIASYGYGPIELDQVLPDGPEPWPDFKYPNDIPEGLT